MTKNKTTARDQAEQSLPLNIRLVNAAHEGNPQKIKSLLREGADPLGFIPTTGVTALIAASRTRENHRPGENFSTFLNRRHSSRSPAHSKRRMECIKILAPISDVNAVDSLGRTALMATMCSAGSSAVEILLPGSDLAMTDFNGDSTLTLAAAFGNAEAVKLLANVPTVGMADADGHTALMLAAGRQLGAAHEGIGADPYLVCFDILLAGPHRETMPDPQEGGVLAYISDGGSAAIFKSYWRDLLPEEKIKLHGHLCQAFAKSCQLSHVDLARAIAVELPPSRAERTILAALISAAADARLSIVETFATKERCRSFSPNLETPLMAALRAQQYDSALMRCLIPLSDLSQKNNKGRTPLRLALEPAPKFSIDGGGGSRQEKKQKNYALALRRLATREACAKVDEEGQTPLMNALTLSMPPNYIGIIAEKSDLSQCNPAGKCALAVAASGRSIDSLMELAGRRQPSWCHTQALREAFRAKKDAHAASLLARADQGAFDEFGRAGFLQAVAAGCIETVKMLGVESLPHQRDLSLQNAFDVAIESNLFADATAHLLHVLLDICDLREIEDYPSIRERLSDLFFGADAAEPQMLLAHFDAQLEGHELRSAIPIHAGQGMTKRNAL